MQHLWRTIQRLSRALLADITDSAIDTFDYYGIIDDANQSQPGYTESKNQQFLNWIEILIQYIISKHKVVIAVNGKILYMEHVPHLNSKSNLFPLRVQWRSLCSLILHIKAGDRFVHYTVKSVHNAQAIRVFEQTCPFFKKEYGRPERDVFPSKRNSISLLPRGLP